ncbi:MAG TPA: PilZ domain-containing protein [Solirubrobacteraceae bacterium]|nr:PilZ domain-containing protein [Solirubrobacteraceae bacterium]
MTRLEQGQTVLLRLGAGAAIAARVDSVGADVAVLVLVTPPLHPPVAGQPAELEVTSKRGILRFDVTIAGADGRGTVRVAARADGAETVQRRDFVRVDAVVPVVVRDGGPDGPAHEAMTLNVSGGGLLLSGVSGLQEGDSAFVAIDLEDGSAPVEALVTVVRVAERGMRAVRIASVSARDEQRLVRFAFARERQARIARDA